VSPLPDDGHGGAENTPGLRREWRGLGVTGVTAMINGGLVTPPIAMRAGVVPASSASTVGTVG
jgi:hypothetical protein